jgi:hypothetical protein
LGHQRVQHSAVANPLQSATVKLFDDQGAQEAGDSLAFSSQLNQKTV